MFKDKQAMLWIRDFAVDKNKLNDRIVIHGHRPQQIDFILNQKIEKAVNIDGGCVYKERHDYGNLVALSLTEQKFVTVKNCD